MNGCKFLGILIFKLDYGAILDIGRKLLELWFSCFAMTTPGSHKHDEPIRL